MLTTKSKVQYRLLADGGIFDNYLNKEVGFIWDRNKFEVAWGLKGVARSNFIKKYLEED